MEAQPEPVKETVTEQPKEESEKPKEESIPTQGYLSWLLSFIWWK